MHNFNQLLVVGNIPRGGAALSELWDQKLFQSVRQRKSVTENYDGNLAALVSLAGAVAMGSLLILSIVAGYQTPSLF